MNWLCGYPRRTRLFHFRNTEQNGEAVSYTHLDVYKRQRLGYAFFDGILHGVAIRADHGRKTTFSIIDRIIQRRFRGPIALPPFHDSVVPWSGIEHRS